MRARHPLAAAAALAAAAVLLSGCTDAGGMVQRRDTGGQTRYVAGTGVVDRIPEAQRSEPVDFAAPLLDGGTWRLADQRGSVVVLNVWGSWCPPCRKEAPDLQAASEELAGRDVVFVGVNTKDTKGGARSFLREFGITYPTVYDELGEALLAFRATLPPSAIPTTLVIDREGRVAARALGALDRGTVVGMVEDVLAEPS